jgi:hypothetical protein
MSLNTGIEEIIHGVPVNDPYRWLEDRQFPDTEKWLHEQKQRCDAFFRACQKLSAVESRVRKYLGAENVDQPARVGNRYFYRKRREGREQGSICIREMTSGRVLVLVDPMREGKFTSVGINRVSPDASLLAFTVKLIEWVARVTSRHSDRNVCIRSRSDTRNGVIGVRKISPIDILYERSVILYRQSIGMRGTWNKARQIYCRERWTS